LLDARLRIATSAVRIDVGHTDVGLEMGIVVVVVVV
jgi:hypothetical protein